MKKYLLLIILLFVFVQAILAQAVGDFRSRQTGDWTNSDTWEEVTSIGPVVWSNTANTPTSANGAISILSGHVVTLQSGEFVTVDQLSVLSNATLNINSGSNLFINNGSGTDLTITPTTGGRFGTPRGIVNIFGVLSLNESATLSYSISNLLLKSGGTFNLNYSTTQGTIPTLSWVTGSTLLISGNTTNDLAPLGLNQTFYNFTWDTPSSTAVFIDLNLEPVVLNNFTVESTGTTFLVLASSGTASYNIGGDFVINNSSLVDLDFEGTLVYNIAGDLILNDNALLSMAYIANTTVNVSGDLNINGGLLDIDADEFGGAPNGLGIINLSGSLLCNGGEISRTGNGLSEINFNGSGIIDFTNQPTIDINYEFATNSSYDIIEGYFAGNGDFVINDNVTLGISDPGGISTGTSTGNIRIGLTGTRTYGSDLTFKYIGDLGQVVGNGLPANDFNLTIDNPNGVTLSSNLEISGPSVRVLNLLDGNLIISNFTLTLDGTVSTTAGGLSGGPNSNLVIGGTGAFGTLGFVGTNSLNNFTINRTSSGSVTLGDDLTVLGDFTQSAGNLILNGNQLSLSGDFTQSSGSITSNSTSIINISGAGTLPSPISISGNAQKIILNRSGATFNTGPSIITADTLYALSGDFSFSGTALKVADGGYVKRNNGASFVNVLSSPGSFDIEYDINSALTTGNELPTATDEINNIIKNGTGVLTLNSNITINGNLDLLNGGFDAGTRLIDIKGDLLLDAVPTFENATFTFSGTTALTGTEQPNFGNITVTGSFNPGTDLAINGNLVNNGSLTAGSGTATFGGTTTISGSNGVTFNNINIAAPASLTAPSAQTLTVSGNFTNAGTFDANGGAIIFDGNTSFSGTTPDLHTVQINGILNAPGTLVVAGNFTNNGTFNNNNGLLDLTGTGTRTIEGSSALSLYALNVDGGTINNNSALTVTDGITVGASTTLDLDGAGAGSVTLISTASKDAYIAEIPSGSSVTGNITVQRAIYTTDAGDNAFHIVGFPMTGVTVSDIQAEIPVTGTFTGKSTGTGFDNNPSIYAYDENVNAAFTLDERYVAFPTSNNSETFNVGEGYHIYTYPGVLPATIDGTGSVFTGDFSQSLTFTGTGVDAGWHALANPYPAPTNWQQWGKTAIEGGTAYLYNSSNGNYITYDGSGVQLIPQGQGFFVRATSGAAEVTASEASKVVGSTPVFYRTGEPIQRFEIILSTPEYDDNAIVHLNDEATDAYEASLDATRLLNTFETISTLSTDGKVLKVNRMAGRSMEESCIRSLSINLEQMENGVTYQLSFKDLGSINGYNFELVDHYTETTMTLSGDEQISFTVNNDELSKGANRFELIFEKNQPIATNVLDISTCASEDAILTLPTTELNTIYYVERNGETVQEIIGNGSQQTFTILNDSLTAGQNDFQLKASNSICDLIAIDSFTITVDEPIRTDVLLTGSEVCSSSNTANYAINSQLGITYYLLLGEDTLATIIGDGSVIENTLEISTLNSGENLIQVLAEKPNCGQTLLDSNLIITIDAFAIDENINYHGSSVCEAGNATVTINTQESVDYSVLLDNQVVQFINGDGQAQTFSINPELLQQGTNSFILVGKYKECSELVFSKEIEIEVYNQLQISGVSNQSICKGEALDINLTSNSSNATYQLFFEDSLINENTTAQFNFIPQFTGDYKVIGFNDHGCISNEIIFNVQLITLEVPTVIANINKLEASVVADAYQWYKNGELLVGKTSATITVEETGAYAVEVLNDYCSKISEVYEFDAIVLGVNGISASSISFYPNPVRNNLRIVFDNIELNQLKVTIFTTSGVKLKEYKDVSSNQELDLSTLNPGVYLVKFSDGTKEYNARIVKQ